MTPHPEHIPLTEQVLTERLGLSKTGIYYGVNKLPSRWVILAANDHEVYISTTDSISESKVFEAVAELQLAVWHMFGIELTFKE